VLLVVSIREQYTYFVYAYVVPTADIVSLPVSVSGTHSVHGYRSQHLQLDGRIGEQYFVDGTVEQLFGILFTYVVPTADIVSLPVLSPRIHPNLTSPVIV
jgi:hypothetical protein